MRDVVVMYNDKALSLADFLVKHGPVTIHKLNLQITFEISDPVHLKANWVSIPQICKRASLFNHRRQSKQICLHMSDE